MRRIGICSKCGETKIVQDHHFKGYETDEVKPYCNSCDQKAHAKAKNEGKCLLNGKESHRKSTNSSGRRSTKYINLFNITMIPFVTLRCGFIYNKNTENLSFNSGFYSNHGKDLKVYDV